MKSQRNLSRPEPRRVGNVVIIAAMLLSLCILSLIKARYCSTAPYEKPDDNMRFEAEGNELLKKTVTKAEDKQEEATPNSVDANRLTCFQETKRSETCEAHGDIRVQGSSQTIFVDQMQQQEKKIKPYSRKHDPVAMAQVTEWTFKPFAAVADQPPACTVNSSVPALILSVGGFTGNLFHDYTDLLVPVFITSYKYRGEIQLLASNYKSWWVNKFMLIFKQLSKYEMIDVNSDQEVRCYPKVIVGPTYHKEIGIDPSKSPKGYSIVDFKKMLREAFGLERAKATPTGDQWDIRRKPRLLIISRKSTRRFLNERAMVDMAMSLGFDVRIGEPDMNTEVGKFARLVNSADVMIGVHGAGLTNMVFLPAGAVLIQVVPYGGLEWLAKSTFDDPAKDMEINYMEYKIQLDETTLSEQYPKDHPVLKDYYAIHKQGWDAIKTIYLDKQNLRPHLGRLKITLQEALKLLPHSHV